MRNLAYFLIGLVITMYLGIASANAAYCTIVKYVPMDGRYIQINSVESTPEQLMACTTPVLLTPNEYQQYQNKIELFGLTPEQGLEIGMSIVLVWAVAFGFRMVVRALHVGESQTEKE